MNCDASTKVWELAPDELIGLDDGRGATLRVTRGTLWLTFERDTRDVVLTAGDSFTVDRAGLTLAQAHGRTTVCVLARRVQARRILAGREPAAARLRRWLGSLVDGERAPQVTSSRT